jgi:hypothetical protein
MISFVIHIKAWRYVTRKLYIDYTCHGHGHEKSFTLNRFFIVFIRGAHVTCPLHKDSHNTYNTFIYIRSLTPGFGMLKQIH